MDQPRIRRALPGLLLPLFAACCAAPAAAQAWLPPQGELSLSFGYGNNFVNRHYLGTPANPGDNVENDFGHIRTQNFGMALQYGITDRLAASVALPFVYSKYYGTPGQNFFPHTIPNDDGNYHGTFQDYRINLQYQAVRGPVALTPFVSVIIPSHSYTYFAHTAVGRDLYEGQLGASFGALLDRVVPGSYVELTYSYAFVEKVLGIHHDRSNGILELGYFLTPSLSVRAIGSGYYTHGGLVFDTPLAAGPPVESNPLFFHHDQIGHDSGIFGGGGLSYQLTGSMEVSASYLTQVLGHGGHKIKDSWGFGITYSFSPTQVVRRYFPSKSAKTPGGTP